MYLKDPQVTWSPGLSCGLCFFIEWHSPVHKISSTTAYGSNDRASVQKWHIASYGLPLAWTRHYLLVYKNYKWVISSGSKKRKTRCIFCLGEWRDSATQCGGKTWAGLRAISWMCSQTGLKPSQLAGFHYEPSGLNNLSLSVWEHHIIY